MQLSILLRGHNYWSKHINDDEHIFAMLLINILTCFAILTRPSWHFSPSHQSDRIQTWAKVSCKVRLENNPKKAISILKRDSQSIETKHGEHFVVNYFSDSSLAQVLN
ncbi:hypothetical protein EUGRSUZ_C01659 [Eucalyptus grandis]|uniref:Uncharacterized protein n=2 Tax=Eucalyptus grandis TaxID=71139 RepID=A0ACC3LF29_EUCGR|nr:hypothetical protein EUGRSUZ_C01659 [Eucalyptus grandis]